MVDQELQSRVDNLYEDIRRGICDYSDLDYIFDNIGLSPEEILQAHNEQITAEESTEEVQPVVSTEQEEIVTNA